MKPLKTILLITGLALVLAGRQAPQTTTADQKCVVSGRVTNALTGEPVHKVKLHLRPTSGATAQAEGGDEPGHHGYFTWSDADGRFEFTGIEAGSYSLSGDHLGFITTNYGAKKQGESGATLLARAGRPISGLTLTLIPGAVISGKVTDDDGDPVSRAQIQVIVQTWDNGKVRYAGRSGSTSDDRGEFRISDLEAGTYTLSAQKRMSFRGGTEMDGKPQTSFVTTFYPAATSAESATPIHVQAGQQISDIEIRLHAAPSFHIRGKVAGVADGARAGRMMMSIMPEKNDGFRFRGFVQVKEDGTFDVSGVAPGTYRLMVMMAPATNGSYDQFSSQPVTVTSEDINELTLAPRPVISVHGQVRVAGAPPAGAKPWNPSHFHFTLMYSDIYGGPRGHTGAAAKTDGTSTGGTFTIENVAQGDYWFETSGKPDGAYLQSVRFNGEEILGKKLDLTRSTSGELVLLFRYGAPELILETKVPAAQMDGGVRPPAPTLVLLPDPAREDGSGVEARQADENGSFTFKELTPGSYRAFAFQEIDRNVLGNPAFVKAIAAKGTLIELKEGDRKKVELPLIPAGEMQLIMAKLGMNAE